MKRSAFTLAALAYAGAANAQAAGDPAGSSLIAVAVVGFLMLTGRMDWRRGLTVVIGCFIVFGAVSIVAGIRSLASGLH